MVLAATESQLIEQMALTAEKALGPLTRMMLRAPPGAVAKAQIVSEIVMIL